MRVLIFYILIVVCSNNVLSARILGLFPHTGKSHHMVFNPFLRRLAEIGHDVTAVTFYPLDNPPEHYEAVDLRGIAELRDEGLHMSAYEHKSHFLRITGLGRIRSHLTEIHPLANYALNVCSELVEYKPLAEVLEKKYDVILMENLNSDCMIGLLHVYENKAPIVYLCTCPTMYWTSDRFGITDNPSYVPIVSSMFTNPMSFWQRFENTVLNIYFKVWFRYSIQLKEQRIIEEHFNKTIADLRELSKNVSLILVNVHHSLNGVRPTVPALVEVGGMHLDKAKYPLPLMPGKNYGGHLYPERFLLKKCRKIYNYTDYSNPENMSRTA